MKKAGRRESEDIVDVTKLGNNQLLEEAKKRTLIIRGGSGNGIACAKFEVVQHNGRSKVRGWEILLREEAFGGNRKMMEVAIVHEAVETREVTRRHTRDRCLGLPMEETIKGAHAVAVEAEVKSARRFVGMRGYVGFWESQSGPEKVDGGEALEERRAVIKRLR